MNIKLLWGVGVNDADYKVSKTDNYRQVWLCPYYVRWRGMLRRCYDPKALVKQPWYTGCSVIEDWFLFSNFKYWCELQESLYNINIESMELDKDFLKVGNKVYSPDTCILIPKEVNVFVVDRSRNRGNKLSGASYVKRLGKWRGRVKNPFKDKEEHLGTFDTEYEAHLAWKKRKLELAEELILTGCVDYDSRIKESLRERYR